MANLLFFVQTLPYHRSQTPQFHCPPKQRDGTISEWFLSEVLGSSKAHLDLNPAVYISLADHQSCMRWIQIRKQSCFYSGMT